jgi:hypothetical protein
VENLKSVLPKTKRSKKRKRIEKNGSSISKNNVREKKQIQLSDKELYFGRSETESNT